MWKQRLSVTAYLVDGSERCPLNVIQISIGRHSVHRSTNRIRLSTDRRWVHATQNFEVSTMSINRLSFEIKFKTESILTCEQCALRALPDRSSTHRMRNFWINPAVYQTVSSNFKRSKTERKRTKNQRKKQEKKREKTVLTFPLAVAAGRTRPRQVRTCRSPDLAQPVYSFCPRFAILSERKVDTFGWISGRIPLDWNLKQTFWAK